MDIAVLKLVRAIIIPPILPIFRHHRSLGDAMAVCLLNVAMGVLAQVIALCVLLTIGLPILIIVALTTRTKRPHAEPVPFDVAPLPAPLPAPKNRHRPLRLTHWRLPATEPEPDLEVRPRVPLERLLGRCPRKSGSQPS